MGASRPLLPIFMPIVSLFTDPLLTQTMEAVIPSSGRWHRKGLFIRM